VLVSFDSTVRAVRKIETKLTGCSVAQGSLCRSAAQWFRIVGEPTDYPGMAAVRSSLVRV